MAAESIRLDEFDADEWFDVWRHFNPSGTREKFDAVLAEFQQLKAAHAAAERQQ